ncbi:uncharacterized protein LOC122577424 [Bombus pyrosoma]|uniref:uncharacterized protein LOC122577424 n=1 Tax=Bombus pyrosoma TaxID=396416 RepID=UPI001CB93082|nr:uncharacterized protein LOC122577424 [Bombus pyrosoma]
MCAMANTGEIANGTQRAHQTIHMLPLQTSEVAAWFTLLEMQFEDLDLTDDKRKFLTLARCLGGQYLSQIADVNRRTPEAERYEKLKGEIIRELADTADSRSRKLLISEEIGDRKPSQFYQHLRRLANPSLPDDFLLTLWRERLPDYLDSPLDAADGTDIEKLMRLADRTYERHVLKSRKVAVIEKERTSDRRRSDSPETSDDRFSRLEAQIEALRLDCRRHQGPNTRGHRPRPGEIPRDSGLCYYHAKFRAHAKKCRPPCTWNQGNETGRP